MNTVYLHVLNLFYASSTTLEVYNIFPCIQGTKKRMKHEVLHWDICSLFFLSLIKEIAFLYHLMKNLDQRHNSLLLILNFFSLSQILFHSDK